MTSDFHLEPSSKLLDWREFQIQGDSTFTESNGLFEHILYTEISSTEFGINY